MVPPHGMRPVACFFQFRARTDTYPPIMVMYVAFDLMPERRKCIVRCGDFAYATVGTNRPNLIIPKDSAAKRRERHMVKCG